MPYSGRTLLAQCLFLVFLSEAMAERDPNALSMFTVLRWQSTECGSGEDMGVCTTLWSCLTSGGTIVDDCASGYGVCCSTKLQCGGSTSNNSTYLQSPGYSSTFNYATTCTFTINLSSDTCQLRMDIVTLDLAPPDTTGTCQDDYMTVSQDMKFDRICGTTNDNHFYLDVDYSTSTSVVFTFTTSATSYDRRWNIKISQICCDQLSLAPPGCGQYFTGTSGTAKGFNADGPTSSNQYLTNLNYAICFRKELNQCSTTYTEEDRFVPMCDDTFEWPRTFGINTPCTTASLVATTSVFTTPVLGPNYIYLTTDGATSNTHPSQNTGFGYNYVIQYSQNSC